MDPKLVKVLWYLGLLSVIIGLSIAAAGTAQDYSVGGLGFGDPLRGAMAVSMAAVIFGIFLLQFTANEELSKRINELIKINSNIKAEVPGLKTPKGILGLLGMIITPMSALAMVVITFKDYSAPTTFNIGGVKTFLLFGSGLVGLVGLGLMALYNKFLTATLHQATKKLKDLWTEQEKELADMVEAVNSKPAEVAPPQYYYQPQQSYYEPQPQAPIAPPPQVVEEPEPEPEPLPPPPKPKIKTPPPLPPPVVKMIPPPLPPPIKPKEKPLPPPIEPVKEAPNKTSTAGVVPKTMATCPKCGRTVKSQWKICPFCGLDFKSNQ